MSLQFFGRVEINDAEGLLVREMLWVTLRKGRAPLNGFEGLRFQKRLQFLGLFSRGGNQPAVRTTLAYGFLRNHASYNVARLSEPEVLDIHDLLPDGST